MWAEAKCIGIDTEIFFDKTLEPAAIKICSKCPIKLLCAEYAIRNDEQYGVWGGLTETDRTKIRTVKNSRRGIPNKKR
jgi:WhiB family redox-sensing transcriptional regulator